MYLYVHLKVMGLYPLFYDKLTLVVSFMYAVNYWTVPCSVLTIDHVNLIQGNQQVILINT